MMGYSVDNIAPGVPTVMAIAMNDSIQVRWNMISDDDFQYFVLEKSQSVEFSEVENFEMTDTLFTDINFTFNEPSYYRIRAVDYSGNHSEYSEVVENIR